MPSKKIISVVVNVDKKNLPSGNVDLNTNPSSLAPGRSSSFEDGRRSTENSPCSTVLSSAVRRSFEQGCSLRRKITSHPHTSSTTRHNSDGVNSSYNSNNNINTNTRNTGIIHDRAYGDPRSYDHGYDHHESCSYGGIPRSNSNESTRGNVGDGSHNDSADERDLGPTPQQVVSSSTAEDIRNVNTGRCHDRNNSVHHHRVDYNSYGGQQSARNNAHDHLYPEIVPSNDNHKRNEGNYTYDPHYHHDSVPCGANDNCGRSRDQEDRGRWERHRQYNLRVHPSLNDKDAHHGRRHHQSFQNNSKHVSDHPGYFYNEHEPPLAFDELKDESSSPIAAVLGSGVEIPPELNEMEAELAILVEESYILSGNQNINWSYIRGQSGNTLRSKMHQHPDFDSLRLKIPFLVRTKSSPYFTHFRKIVRKAMKNPGSACYVRSPEDHEGSEEGLGDSEERVDGSATAGRGKQQMVDQSNKVGRHDQERLSQGIHRPSISRPKRKRFTAQYGDGRDQHYDSSLTCELFIPNSRSSCRQRQQASNRVPPAADYDYHKKTNIRTQHLDSSSASSCQHQFSRGAEYDKGRAWDEGYYGCRRTSPPSNNCVVTEAQHSQRYVDSNSDYKKTHMPGRYRRALPSITPKPESKEKRMSTTEHVPKGTSDRESKQGSDLIPQSRTLELPSVSLNMRHDSDFVDTSAPQEPMDEGYQDALVQEENGGDDYPEDKEEMSFSTSSSSASTVLSHTAEAVPEEEDSDEVFAILFINRQVSNQNKMEDAADFGLIWNIIPLVRHQAIELKKKYWNTTDGRKYLDQNLIEAMGLSYFEVELALLIEEYCFRNDDAKTVDWSFIKSHASERLLAALEKYRCENEIQVGKSALVREHMIDTFTEFQGKVNYFLRRTLENQKAIKYQQMSHQINQRMASVPERTFKKSQVHDPALKRREKVEAGERVFAYRAQEGNSKWLPGTVHSSRSKGRLEKGEWKYHVCFENGEEDKDVDANSVILRATYLRLTGVTEEDIKRLEESRLKNESTKADKDDPQSKTVEMNTYPNRRIALINGISSPEKRKEQIDDAIDDTRTHDAPMTETFNQDEEAPVLDLCGYHSQRSNSHTDKINEIVGEDEGKKSQPLNSCGGFEKQKKRVFKPGERVYARWLVQGNCRWYPGTIIGRGTSTYHVIFDDGDEDVCLDGMFIMNYTEYLKLMNNRECVQGDLNTESGGPVNSS